MSHTSNLKNIKNALHLTHEEELYLDHIKYSGDGWEELQNQFDIYNEQFFNGTLPKVLIVSGYRSDSVGGLCFGDKIIFISNDDPFLMNCKLLHEMLHLSNAIRGINDVMHGFKWIESMAPIHKALNISIDIYELAEDEALMWPHIMFESYGIRLYFEKCFNEFGHFRPLPTGWHLDRSKTRVEGKGQLITLDGCPDKDLSVLQDRFGLEYIKKIKEIECNTKF